MALWSVFPAEIQQERFPPASRSRLSGLHAPLGCFLLPAWDTGGGERGSSQLPTSRDRLTDAESGLVVTRGRVGADKWELEIRRCRPLYRKEVNGESLLCSTGNCIRYLVVTYHGKEGAHARV